MPRANPDYEGLAKAAQRIAAQDADRHTPSEEGSEAEYHEWWERQTAPCCGEQNAYCECTELRRANAALRAAIARDNDTPRMSDDDARRLGDPPF